MHCVRLPQFVAVSTISLSLLAGLVSNGRGQGDQTIELSDALKERCLTTLREGMRSDEFWPSIHAAEGLTLAGRGHEVISYLEPKLPSEKDAQHRCGLARELVRAGDRRRAQIMLDILAADDPYGHTHAAESLFKVEEIGDGQAMRLRMSSSDNITTRLMAAASLGRWGNPAAMKLLRERLSDSNPEVSRIAVWVLARIGDKSDIPQLKKNLAAAGDDISRCYVVNALATLGDTQGRNQLLKNLAHQDPAVRTYSATFAGDARATQAKASLIRLLDDDNIDVRVRSAQSLMVLASPAPLGGKEDVSRMVYEASAKHPRYTEGSIVQLNDGALLFAVTRFVGGGSDFSRAQIVARRSVDGGRTWQPPRVLQESDGKMNVMSASLLRLQAPREKTIALFYLQKNDFNDLRVYVRFSNDEAKTFGTPVRVTAEPGYHVMNNDRVVQLSSGRLLAPVASTEDVRKVNHFVSRCWLSDDGGRTWSRGSGSVDVAKRGAMEPEVIELSGGKVLMIVRTQLGTIAASRSDDGGKTWSEPKPLSNLKAPEAPATLRRIPSTGDLMLIWNNTFQAGAGHGGRRTPLTAAISADDGATWQHVRNLEDNSNQTFSYTSLAFIRGRAVMSYWVGQDGKLSCRFRSLPLSWFYADSAAKPGAKPPANNASPKRRAAFRWVNPPNQSWPGVQHATFTSPSMKKEVGYCIYLPLGYDDAKNGPRRYPVVYYLHGGRPGSESKSVRLAEHFRKHQSAGRVAPMIYVFVNGGPVSHYNMPGRKDAQGEDVFVKELIPHVDATYRTIAGREGRGIEGFSQGGRGTTRIMFKYPQLFGSAAPGGAGHATEKRISEEGGRESDQLQFAVGDNTWDLARRYAKNPNPKLPILIHVGTKGFNYENNLEYMKLLDSLKIPYQRLIVEGVPHSATQIYAKRGLEIMQFHAKNLKTE